MPNKMKLMSAERQQQIVEAVKTAADLHNDGEPASAAIAKTASEAGFNEHEAKLMVDAFNTSKTLAHMRTADGVEKAASFELADYDEVSQLMGPVEDKAALATDYAFDGHIPDYRKVASASTMDKTAYQVVEDSNGVAVPLDKVSTTLDTDNDLVFRSACDAADYWRKEADAKRAEYDGLRFRVADACSALADHFKMAGNLQGWPTFAKEARELHGPLGEQVVDTLNKDFGLQALADRHGCKHAAVTVPDESTRQHKTLKVAVLSAEVAAGVKLEEQQLRAKHAEAKEALFPKKAEAVSKEAGIGTMAMMGLVGRSIRGDDEGAVKAPAPRTVDLGLDAGLESEYGNARTQLLLRDMLERDEVLAQHSEDQPDQVFQALNELTSFRPELASQPIALRAALRRHLELGQTEPHELEQMKKLVEPDRQTALMNPGAVQ